MTLLDTLQDEMKVAMRSRDQARLDALRLMVSAIRYALVDSPNLSDEQIIEVLKKEAKKRREAIEAYRLAGRDGAVKQEQYELSLIETYLPKTMSEAEVRELVAGILQAVDSKTSFGQVMQVVMKEMKGQADGGVVSKIVKELFSNNPKS